MHKQAENLRKCVIDFRNYADHLESLLGECHQYHKRSVDFRAARPPDPDLLLGQEDDSDVMMGGDGRDNDQGSDDGTRNDHSAIAIISIPPLSLQVRLDICIILLSMVLNNVCPYKGRTLHYAFSISSSR